MTDLVWWLVANADLMVVAVCALVGLLSRARAPAHQRALVGAAVGVGVLLAIALVRLISNASIGVDLGWDINWVWLLVIGGVLLIALYLAQEHQRRLDALADADTFRRYLRHMRAELGVPAADFPTEIEDRIVARLHATWAQTLERAVHLPPEGPERTRKQAELDALDQRLHGDIRVMLPTSFRERWEAAPKTELEEITRRFFDRFRESLA